MKEIEGSSTILVTGSAGFIGSHVVHTLVANGHRVIGVDNFNTYYDPLLKEARNRTLCTSERFTLYRGDIADLALVKKVFSENVIDKICHLAAQAGVRYSLTHPHTYVASNLTGFANVLDEAKNAGIKDFIYASSSSVYGMSNKTPSSVSDPTDKPISLYAATKKANELMAYTYHYLYGMNCIGLRYFTVYGPWGRPDMAPFLFTKSILEGAPIRVFNYGKMRRDFTYIDDIVAGTLAALRAKHSGYEVFNLGGEKPEELMDFITAIEKATEKKAKMEMFPIQPGDVLETAADIDRSREILGFEPRTTIEEGVPRFVEWYKSYHSV